MIDWTNQLTRGLSGYFLMTTPNSGRIENIASPLYPATVVGATDFTDRGTKFDGTNDGATIPSGVLDLNEGTTFFVCKMAAASSETGVFRNFHDSDSARHVAQKTSSANTILVYNNVRQQAYTATWAAGDVVAWAFVYNKTGNVQLAYKNGVLLPTSGAASGTWGSTALGTNFHLFQRFNGTERMGAECAAMAIWRRNLNPSEILEVSSDPTRFLEIDESSIHYASLATFKAWLNYYAGIRNV